MKHEGWVPPDDRKEATVAEKTADTPGAQSDAVE